MNVGWLPCVTKDAGKMTGLPLRNMKKANKKLCIRCGKRRSRELFRPRARICEICQEVETVTKHKAQNTLPSLKKKAQTLFNAYIRERDKGLGCISCVTGKVEHAGHWWSVGANSFLRYDPDNVNGQCSSCNNWKSGNSAEYRIGLVKKIGEKRVVWLEDHRKDSGKWTRDELLFLIEEYK